MLKLLLFSFFLPIRKTHIVAELIDTGWREQSTDPAVPGGTAEGEAEDIFVRFIFDKEGEIRTKMTLRDRDSEMFVSTLGI
jgi:hypothetical protein